MGYVYIASFPLTNGDLVSCIFFRYRWLHICCMFFASAIHAESVYYEIESGGQNMTAAATVMYAENVPYISLTECWDIWAVRLRRWTASPYNIQWY